MPIRPKDRDELRRIDAVLAEFHTDTRRLPGIQDQARRQAFLDQLFDSIHRIQFIEQGVLCRRGEPRGLDANYANPSSDMFDPIRAAAIRAGEGEA
jgi:hypothetical protein